MNNGTTAQSWTLREMAVIAALGVVFGVVYMYLVPLWIALNGIPAIGALATDIMLGLWCIASVIAAYIIRKPLVAFTTEVVAALVEVLAGTPGGLIIILTGVIQGAGAELPFAATRWRNYGYTTLMASGACAALFSFVYNWFRFGYASFDPGLLVVMFVLRIASGIVFAGLLGGWLSDRLRATGVLRGLAIDSDVAAPQPMAGRAAE